MALRHLRRHLAALAALLLVALLAPLTAPEAVAQRPVARVYVLEGGDAASDQAAVQALRQRGLNVTRGVAATSFDGTQADLKAFDVVVLLATANGGQPVPAGGLQAIGAFVESGGGLVVGEWFVSRGQLANLMPATSCGSGSATTTTYTQRVPNPRVNAGLPASFSFSLGNFAGSESCLTPRPEATTLYGSAAGGAGLVAWNVGLGRVVAFSTLLGATELASTEYRTLFQNTVAWSADVRDATPPTVQRVELAQAGGMVRAREIELSVKAADRGGSGVGAVIVAEYVFTDDGDTWRLAATSGWRRYRQPGATLSLTLADTPGVHYLHIYAADRAGNVSARPLIAFINYQPPGPTPIGLDEAHLYRVALARSPAVTARMQVFAGNPDLSVRGPGVLLTPQSDAAVEELTFATRRGVYELGVIGHEAGSYTLTYGEAPLVPLTGDGDAGILKRGRGSVINAVPQEPDEDPGGLPEPPEDDTAAGPEMTVFLPLVERP